MRGEPTPQVPVIKTRWEDRPIRWSLRLQLHPAVRRSDIEWARRRCQGGLSGRPGGHACATSALTDYLTSNRIPQETWFTVWDRKGHSCGDAFANLSLGIASGETFTVTAKAYEYGPIPWILRVMSLR